ncbi:MAG TPA: MFS transporter [Candidatus Competibacteraceae bacterium]|nr:MFS transporter [Candidatus Competibacteraceae bacterium]
MSARPASVATLPAGVWALGLVSLCMDLSSEMIHAVLPLYLVSVLGVGTLAVGIIEGIAEATAAITKVFSGALSDWCARRKPLVLAGYGLAALTKPVFALAPTVDWVVAARFADRLGKGIRGAPRDALVADLTPPPLLGAAYGLRQALDTVGAFAGPLAAMALMALTMDDYRTVFWIAVLPAVLAVTLIVFGVHEPESHRAAGQERPRLARAELRRLGAAYWWAVGAAVVLTLARFSEAFLLLRAESVGLAVAAVPVVLVVMNVVYALSAYPAGRLSDRLGRWGLLAAGGAVLIAADAVLAVAGDPLAVLAGAALWGLHMGLTQGLLSALVAAAAPAALRGTAFGLFHLLSGIALLAASVIAGGLWSWLGPAATFAAGAGFTTLALALLTAGARRLR